MHLMKAGRNEIEQRGHRLFGVFAIRLDDNRGAAFRRQRHHAEDALPVDDGVVLANLNGRFEAIRDLDEFGSWPDVHAERVHDAGFALDHGHTSATTSATAARPSVSRSPLRCPAARGQRSARKASPATIASVMRGFASKGQARYWVVSGNAAPMANAIAGPSTAPARWRNG